MRKRHNYKNLEIWKKGLDIANEVSDILSSFPKNEQYNLTSQMSRSSISIPSNIAEGSSRTDKAFLIFLDYAIGSSFELGTQILIANHRNYIKSEIKEKLEEKIMEWQKMTMSFQNRLANEIKSEKRNAKNQKNDK